MNIGAPTLLASYAYTQAGGGSAGVSAALNALASSAKDVAALVKQTGPGQTFDLLEASKANALDVATYSLKKAAGKGQQVVQDLLNPPQGYANPLLTPKTVINPNLVGAYAKLQYQEAQKAGEGAALTQQATGGASQTVDQVPTGLYASAIPVNAKTLASDLLRYDSLDANKDGMVSPAETLGYTLQHPYLDPKDTNADGLVSPAEELAYSLQHPAQGILARLIQQPVDLLA